MFPYNLYYCDYRCWDVSEEKKYLEEKVKCIIHSHTDESLRNFKEVLMNSNFKQMLLFKIEEKLNG